MSFENFDYGLNTPVQASDPNDPETDTSSKSEKIRAVFRSSIGIIIALTGGLTIGTTWAHIKSLDNLIQLCDGLSAGAISADLNRRNPTELSILNKQLQDTLDRCELSTVEKSRLQDVQRRISLHLEMLKHF